jgi:hypothetical protein
MGFVWGIWKEANAINLAKAEWYKDGSPVYCVPNGVTLGQMVKVVVNYLEKHPENLHLNAEDEILSAIRSAWPCRAARNGGKQ